MYKRICQKLFLNVVTVMLIFIVSCNKFTYGLKYFDSHCGLSTGNRNGECYPIYSEEEKADFMNNPNLDSQFKDLLGKYDMNYFLSEYIVILIMPANSSSSQYKLRDVNVSDMITFEIKLVTKSPGTDDLVNKAFIIELSQNVVQKDYKILLSK